MPANSSLDDAYLGRLDEAIGTIRVRVRGALLGAPVVAAALSLLAFLASHPGSVDGKGDESSLAEVLAQWYRWSQGWASSTEAGATSLGLLTAALTLYVATTLAALDRDHTSASGVAARLVLDDVTLMVCLSGSVACWLLSAGAGWTPASALGWASAAATAIVLAVLGGCAETRQLYADRQRWALERAEGRLADRLGPGLAARDLPSWFRTFPWRAALALAVAAALPAMVRIGFRFPHDPVGVVLAGVIVVALWLGVVCATWSWWSDLRAAQLRYRRAVPSDAGATGLFVLLLLVLVAVGTVDLGDEWGVLSLVLLALAMAAPLVTGVGADLRRRALLLHLASVRKALAEAPSATVAPEPERLDPAVSWSIKLGALHVQRFVAGPPAGD